MLTEIYIEALLVDEGLADQVWDAGVIDDRTACTAWRLIRFYCAIRVNRELFSQY